MIFRVYVLQYIVYLKIILSQITMILYNCKIFVYLKHFSLTTQKNITCYQINAKQKFIFNNLYHVTIYLFTLFSCLFELEKQLFLINGDLLFSTEKHF